MSVLTKNGYEFVGWSDGNDMYLSGALYTMPAEEVTFTAQWAEISYSVLYSGGSGATGTAPTQSPLKALRPFIVKSNTFEKTGYEFAGWSDGVNVYDEGAAYVMPANSVTFTAQWNALSYTVTYAGNGNTGGSPPHESSKIYNEQFSLAENTLVKSGYNFVGWSDGNAIYNEGDTYTMPATSVTFAAQWSVELFAVTYEGNGNTGGTLPFESSKAPNEQFTLAENTLVKQGYSFVAWNDGTYDYNAGSTFTMPSNDVSFVAVWEQDSAPPTPTPTPTATPSPTPTPTPTITPTPIPIPSAIPTAAPSAAPSDALSEDNSSAGNLGADSSATAGVSRASPSAGSLGALENAQIYLYVILGAIGAAITGTAIFGIVYKVTGKKRIRH